LSSAELSLDNSHSPVDLYVEEGGNVSQNRKPKRCRGWLSQCSLSYQKIELRTYAHSLHRVDEKERTLCTGPATISGVHNFGCFSKHTNYCIDIEQKPSHDQNSNNDYSD
jgi:hypothetical protein